MLDNQCIAFVQCHQMNKSSCIFVRVTPAQLKLFHDAAEAAGMDLSGWARSVLIVASRRTVKEARAESAELEARQRAALEITK